MPRNERRRASLLVAGQPCRGESVDELAALADAAVSGDRAAVHAFLIRIGPQLLRAVRLVLGSEHSELEGALQASAFAVIDALPRRRREAMVSRFACRLAALAALRVRRREAARRRHAAQPDELHVAEPATKDLTTDVVLTEQSRVQLARDLMDSLPLPQAEVLALHCVLGQSLPEIAESADIPLETVRERLDAVRLTVRERVGLGERLQQALAQSPELGVLHEAGLAFDAQAPALAGDDERIERMASRVAKSTRWIRLSPRELLALKSGALALLIAGVAVAAIQVSRWHPHGARARVAPHVPALSKDLSHDQRLVPVTPEPALREAPPKNQEPRASTPVPSASSTIEAKYRSAGELFADANRARVAGDIPLAIAISELLERTFPNSNEGITTHLSLGVLFLQQGQPNQALGEFKIYRHIGSAALMAEALWGEEQALQQLGQVSEERAVLEELLANYPRSAYVGAAEQRLSALNH